MGTEDHMLRVKMFGGFSISWDGNAISGGLKTGESQFAYLMQLLLHYRESGVGRDRLEEAIFGDRDINDIHHAMQSVVYNAKKRLKSAGLPDVNYIVLKKGVFYWTDQIPVYEDAAEFERLCAEAEQAEDIDVRLDTYMRAIHCYTGEFLPTQTGVIWVVQEARRYRAMFCRCMENILPLLRISHDFEQMEALGLYASRIDPLADWETVTMEALAEMGRYDEARKLYDDTVEYYLREQGLRPSRKMTDFLDKLGEKMLHRTAVLDEIQADLTGDGVWEEGGYLCTYPVFQGIYRMVERMMERGGQSVYLMLCTVVDGKGNTMKEGSTLGELSQRLGEAICRSVRHGDAVCRYGKGQYLVLLINTTRENCKVVQKRINYHFIIGRQRTGIQYYVNSVVCRTDEIRKMPQAASETED